ncbi:MAG: type II secretion system protein [Verrucomicrobiota bacterium]
MKASKRQNGFTLIEMLLVLAIISVMAGLVINAFSNATNDSRNTIARQQQATLQSALNNWISQEIRGTTTLADARNTYNYVGGNPSGTKLTSLQRLALIEDYLDSDAYSHLVANSSASQVRSSAMSKTGQWVTFGDWATTGASYPKVEKQP